jgi:hypothetical protein
LKKRYRRKSGNSTFPNCIKGYGMSEDNQEAIRPPSVGSEEGAGAKAGAGTVEGSGAEGQIGRILDKLQQLLKQRDVLLKENGKLKEELLRMQDDQFGSTRRLEQLQQQVEILGVTKATMSEGEKGELEKRLGQYIREIDRCIALLGE